MLAGMEIVLAVLVAVLVTLVAVVLVVALRRPGSAPPPPIPPGLDPEALLAPIREQLRTVEARVYQSHVDAAQAMTALDGRIEQIARQNAQLAAQGDRLGEATTRISTALQGTGVAGDWGEMQLRRTVELAGLTEHVSFVEQETVTTESGRLRPDLVVMLPEGRNVVVDAKAPLIDFSGAGGAAAQATALKAHINDLGARNYSAYLRGALDFVVLFVPTEGTLGSCLSHDPSLSEYAISKRVLLATPMTLLAMLRAVQYGWMQLASYESSQEIVDDAVKLHDRLATFVDHLNKVGNGLQTAVASYNNAVGSLQSSVRPQAVRMRDHGLAVTKELGEPQALAPEIRSTNWR